MIDLVVEGNAFLDGRLNKCCIGIDEGKIVAIKKILKGDRQLDFGDKLILPAGIDVHVHFRDPGGTDKEDFSTGSLAAAFGGIGCVFDMPNTSPPVISKSRVIEKIQMASRKTYIDFGIYSSITSKTNIPATAGVCSGFKIYLASSTGDLLFADESLLPTVLSQINTSQRIPAIHAESESIIQQNLTKKQNHPPRNLHEHLKTRSNEAEAVAVSNILDIAQSWSNEGPAHKHIHLCHISSAESIDLLDSFQRHFKDQNDQNISNNNNNNNNNIQQNQSNQQNRSNQPNLLNQQIHQNHLVQKKQDNNKQMYVKVTTEVTPHHLLLNENYKGGTLGKVNPPLRRLEDQTALWNALFNGTISILASDHAPHTINDKEQKFDLAPAGLPGVETMLPLMISHVKHNRLNLNNLASAITSNPAELFSLPKGRLAVGCDGDLTVFDLYSEEPIKAKNLHSKCGWTPFEKMDAIFPILTIVRGNIIIKNGNLEADKGTGKFYK